jgi:hypothetical protein
MALKSSATTGQIPAVPLASHPATLPKARIPEDVDVVSVSAKCLENLASGLDWQCLTDNAIWYTEPCLAAMEHAHNDKGETRWH